MAAPDPPLAPSPTDGPPAPLRVGDYEVRWDAGQKLYRIWNTITATWASRPGFSSERVAQAVAEGLSTPIPRAHRT